MPPRSAQERRVQNRAETRRAILEATEALLEDCGHEGFSVRKLVERCGYTAPTLYHYFGDKNGLTDALLQERLGRLVEELERVPPSQDPIAQLRAMCRIFTHWGLRNRTHYQLLMQPRDPDSTPPPAGEEARSLMQRPLEELERRGMIALADAETARQAIWASLHGLISLTSARPDVEWREDLLDQSLEALIRGWFHSDPEQRTAPPPC